MQEVSHFLFEAALEEDLCEAQSVRCRRLEQHTNSAVGQADIHQTLISYVQATSPDQDVCLRRTCMQIMKRLYVAHTLREGARTRTHRKNVLSLDILGENDK